MFSGLLTKATNRIFPPQRPQVATSIFGWQGVVVTPVAAMGCAALVLGYEAQDLDRRFGRTRPRPAVRLAPAEDTPPTLVERLAAYTLVIVPWLVLYELTGHVRGHIELHMPFERRLPVIEDTELIYASTYVAVGIAPMLLRTRRELRRFEVPALLATALCFLLYLTLPIVSYPRAFEPHGWTGYLLAYERSIDTPGNALPSFHVLWALIVAGAFRLRLLFVWALLVGASCVTTGMHAIADVIVGIIVYLLVANAHGVWKLMRRFAERVANSWHEWHFGPVRVINHGLYAGLGSFLAVAIVTLFAMGVDFAHHSRAITKGFEGMLGSLDIAAPSYVPANASRTARTTAWLTALRRRRS